MAHRIICTLMVLSLAFCLPASAASPPGMPPSASTISVAVPPILRSSPQLASVLRNWDEHSILANEVSRQAPTKVLNRNDMSRIRISSETGETVALDNLFDSSFRAQRSIEQQFHRIPAAALTGRPQTTEAVVEFPDRLLLIRQVRIVVRDPRQAAAAAPELARFLAPVDQAKIAQARVMSLDSDLQQSFRRFLTEELPTLDADDPLRRALSEGGEDAVLRAMLSGAGEFEVTDQVVVERKLYNDGQVRLHAELKPLSVTSRQPLEMVPLRPMVRPSQSVDASSLGGLATRGTQYRYPAGDRNEGRFEFNEGFLAGFTLGHEIAWERRWNFSGNFLRVSYGIGYGIGLRIPILINCQFQPTRAVRSAVGDTGQSFELRLSAATADKNDMYYLQTGLPNNLLFGGNEFVFTGGSWLSVKLHALGKDWVNLSPVNSPIHKSYDFTPPLGGTPAEIFTFAIPPKLTRTELDFSVLRGALQVGLGMNGTGGVVLPYALILDGQVQSPQQLVLNGTGVREATMQLPALQATPRSVKQQLYGIYLGAPSYVMQAIAAVRLKLVAKVEAGPLERSIETDWFDVFNAALGQVVMHPHAGTKSGHQWNEGVRIFEARDPSDPATIQGPRDIPRLQ
jgi:hypothetical protein